MVDFAKLNDPASRAESLARTEAAHEQLETVMRQRIAGCVRAFEALPADGAGLGTWDAGFIRSMHNRLDSFDPIVGLRGGLMVHLTDSQNAQIDRMPSSASGQPLAAYIDAVRADEDARVPALTEVSVESTDTAEAEPVSYAPGATEI